jgi:hypothetical protein
MSERSEKARREYSETEAAFASVRDALMAQLLASKIGESLLRDKIVLTLQALEQVRSTVLSVAQDGDYERHIEALQEAMQTPA